MNIFNITDYGAKTDAPDNTAAIQRAIDACSDGGAVVIPAGIFICGAITLRSNMTLRLEKDAVLQGSADYKEYQLEPIAGWRKEKSHWFDAFLCAVDAENITIEGEGVIDGVDCNNPRGEEGFRGPHCIRFFRCNNFRISGLTIRRAANYAMLFIQCKNGTIEDMTVRGGHDGVHAQRCANITIDRCDFRTGDDCIAGSDNRNFTIEDCLFNTSCNGFRLGCMNLTADRCRFWGPGESPHLVSKRNNMLCAVVHFAPPDRGTVLPTGNWKMRDIIVDNVETLYEQNEKAGTWQTGRPAEAMTFERVTATNLASSVLVSGKRRITRLCIKDSSISLRGDVAAQSVLRADCFDAIELRDVSLGNDGKVPELCLSDGNGVVLENVRMQGGAHMDNIGTMVSMTPDGAASASEEETR